MTAVGLNTGLHPLGNMWVTADVPGSAPNAEPVEVHQINAEYPAALNIRLEAGRLFSESDMNGVSAVALVNEQFVRTRLQNRPPLGQTVRLPRMKEAPFGLKDDAFQIVGVLHDTLNRGLTESAMPEVYLPFTVAGVANLLVVRTQTDPAALTRAVVNEVYAADRNQPVTNVQTLERLLEDEEPATPRFSLVLFSIFGLVGLALAVVGVYGVMSSTVAQQKHEIGVRMALGAEAGTIARMVILRGSRLLLVGMAVGLVGSFVAARMLAGQIWNVSPFDPLAFGAVSAILHCRHPGLRLACPPCRPRRSVDRAPPGLAVQVADEPL